MNKKWLTIGGAVGISGVVMVTTGMAAMAGASGYEAYKTALKNTKTVSSVTVAAKATVQDNGTTLIDASGTLKADVKDRTGSGLASVTAGGTDLTASIYKTASQTVFKTSANDVYYVKQDPSRSWKGKAYESNPQMAQQVETVIDALVGNLKDAVTLDPKADGSKEVSLQLTDAQVPALLNALAPIGIKQALGAHEHAWKANGEGKANDGTKGPQLPFDPKQLAGLPQLTQDIKIDNIAVTADINAANEIDHQVADIAISGKDANGASHVLTLHLEANLSGFNATTPDKVDLSGKTVQTLKGNVGRRHGRE